MPSVLTSGDQAEPNVEYKMLNFIFAHATSGSCSIYVATRPLSVPSAFPLLDVRSLVVKYPVACAITKLAPQGGLTRNAMQQVGEHLPARSWLCSARLRRVTTLPPSGFFKSVQNLQNRRL